LWTDETGFGRATFKMSQPIRKKLIEASLPLDAINSESLRRKQKAPKGWPATFHKWWSQKPLATARAILFAQMIDDPSANPELFSTIQDQEVERSRLFSLIGSLIQWDNTLNKHILKEAHGEITLSWERECAAHAASSESADLYIKTQLPVFSDPFSGSGALPLSAQWLGVESLSSDVNPVAVLINKATIEIPYIFAGNSPVNPSIHKSRLSLDPQWRDARGLAEDVRYYGRWMREEMESRIGAFYPKVKITDKMAHGRSDLEKLIGKECVVVAYIWARTVKSPNPAFSHVDVPLTSTFLFSSRPGKEIWVEPCIRNDGYDFGVRLGRPPNIDSVKLGTSAGKRSAFRCLMSGVPITYDHIRNEGLAGRMGARLMVVVADSENGRVYLPPDEEMESVAREAKPTWSPENDLPDNPRDFKTPNYGLTKFSDLFTSRQLLALTTASDLVGEARQVVMRDALAADLAGDNIRLAQGGRGAAAYADAVSVYLACVVDRMAYYGSSLTTWLPKDNALRDCMPRQALAMTWEFAEGNPLGKASGELKSELPTALADLQHGNIAPVDLAQAAIGPGMAVFTRYAQVLDAEGKPLSVRQALALINQTLDEALAEQEGDFDADSRWAVTWFEQSGFAEGDYGIAEQLSKSKNTSVCWDGPDGHPFLPRRKSAFVQARGTAR
jgi:putative DNA methylase